MFLIGDVFATVLILLSAGLAAAAGMTIIALLAPRRTGLAARAIEARPWRPFFIGLAITLPIVLVGIILLSLPLPIAKILGALVLVTPFAPALIGAGGLCRLIAERIRETHESTMYRSIALAAVGITAILLFPFVGWFVTFPLLLIWTVGAGMSSLFATKPAIAPAAEPEIARTP